MTTLSRSQPATGLLGACLRRSRVFASMLPSLLLSGLLTLVVTAVMQLTRDGLLADGFVTWMEIWLTAWPIAFPVTYLAAPAVARLAVTISAPAQTSSVRASGLTMNDIADASARVTSANSFTVLRNLKLKDDFEA